MNLPTLYRYVGPGPGQGEIHRIIMREDTTVITTSLLNGGNHSWMGSNIYFLAHFEVVK